MYRIYVDGVLFFDSTLENMQIESGVITRELNKAGSFKFTIYPEHPYYDFIKELKSVIEVYRRGVNEPIFRGRALYPEIDFFKKKTYTCEGHLNFLTDSIISPFEGSTSFAALVSDHNGQVEGFKRFQVGTVTAAASVTSKEYSPQNTQQAMKKLLLDNYGGYIRPRLNGGVWYLDYLSDFTERCTQVIELGENLGKFTRKDNYADIVTALKAFGKDGISTYVSNATGISLYGTIVGIAQFSEVDNVSTLKSLATSELAERVKKQIAIEVDAIDLSLLNVNIEALSIGKYCRIISKPHSLDDWFLIVKQTINLTDPTKDKVCLGGTFDSFIGQTIGTIGIKNIMDSDNIGNSGIVQDMQQQIAAQNKPSGSYVGYGESSSRTINIGGSGTMLNIASGSFLTMVWNGGGVILNGATEQTSFTADVLNFTNGVLTIVTDHAAVNAKDVTYSYTSM